MLTARDLHAPEVARRAEFMKSDALRIFAIKTRDHSEIPASCARACAGGECKSGLARS